jgi:hypothetical protein
MSAYLAAGKSFRQNVQSNLEQGEVQPESGFYDSFQASLGLFIDENLSISRYINNDVRRDRNEGIRKMLSDGDIPADIASSFVSQTRRGTRYDWDGLAAYANDKLGGEFQTDAELDESIRDTLRQRREYAERTLERTTAGGTAGMLAGGFAAVAMDPLNVAGMLAVPYRAMKGIGIIQNVLRGAGREAAIAATTETAIQPFVMDWKAEIESPYTPIDAIQNIGFAAGFGFALGGIQGGIGAVRGRNANEVVEQDFKVSDLQQELDNLIDVAEESADVIDGDPAATSALSDLKELRDEIRYSAPDGDVQASEHFARIHKELEKQADDSPRYETIDFDEFDDTRLDLELQELGDVEMPIRMEVDVDGQNKFEVDTINNVIAKADEQETRLQALRECVVG